MVFAVGVFAAEESTAGFFFGAVLALVFSVGLSASISGVSNFSPLFFLYIHRGMNRIIAIMIRHRIFMLLVMNLAMAIYSCFVSPH